MANLIHTCGMTIFGGILLCFTSFLPPFDREFDCLYSSSDLHIFSDESYIDVVIVGITGDLEKLVSLEQELEDL